MIAGYGLTCWLIIPSTVEAAVAEGRIPDKFTETMNQEEKTLEETTVMASINSSIHKPFTYSGDALTVNIWLYQFETYLNLVFMGNPQ